MDKLAQVLQGKIKFYNQAASGEKICQIFSWKEFFKIFINTTFLWTFNYKNTEYAVSNEKKISYFYTEGNKNKQYFCLTYTTSEDLLNNANIGGMYLSQIWNQIYIWKRFYLFRDFIVLYLFNPTISLKCRHIDTKNKTWYSIKY